MKLAHRTINNAVFNTMGWMFPLLLGFFFLPYIVGRLGTDAYGILTLVLTVIGYFAVLDLGLGNAAIKYVAEYAAEGDADRTNDVIGSILLLLGFLGLVGGLVLLLLAEPLVTRFLKIPPQLVSAAYISFCLGSAGFLLTMILSVFSAIPNGLNRYDITSIVSLVMGTLTMAGSVMVLYFGGNVVHLVCLNFSITALGVLTYPFILRRIMPSIRLRPVFNITVLRKVLSFGLYSLLSRISYLLTYQVDRIVTGAILGMSSVTYYVVPFNLVNRLTSITVRIGGVIFPAISELQGLSQRDKINDLYIVSSRIIIIINTCICIPLFIFGGRFLTLWMGPDFGRRSGVVLVLVTLGLYLSSFTNIPSFVADGLGLPKITGTASICNAILNVSMLVPMTKYWGITGVAIAFLISNALVAPIFIWYVNNRVLGIPLVKMLKEAYFKPLLAGLATAVPVALFPRDQIDNLYALIVIIMASSAACLALSYLTGAFPRQLEVSLHEYLRKRLGMSGKTSE